MGNLSEIKQHSLVKMINVADSGAGKTGACASLAEAGYEVIFMDFDNGVQILKDVCTKPGNVWVAQFIDEMTASPIGPVSKGIPQAFSKAMSFLHTGKASGIDLGPIYKWDDSRVLVVDSGTFMGDAAMRHTQALNSSLGKMPQIQEWGQAMSLQEKFIEMLCSTAIGCHIIVNFHMKFQADMAEKPDYIVTGREGKKMVRDIRPTKGYPSALGNKLPPVIGRYFNTLISMSSIGPNRFIHTKSDPRIEIKVPVPSKIKDRLSIKTGLAELFAAITKG